MPTEMLDNNRNPERTFLVADIGGTNIRLGLADSAGGIIVDKYLKTRAQRGPEPIIADILNVFKAFLNEAPAADKPGALGVGTPGIVSPQRGVVIEAPNLPRWQGLPLAEILSRGLGGLPVFLENDANLYALGEWRAGAAKGLDNFLGVTLGTGVGGGLILNGAIWQGSFGTSGEIGHVPVIANGYRCGCGCRGCLETVASANAMARQAKEWLLSGQPSRYKGDPQKITAGDLFELAQGNDPMALEIFKRAGQALGLALSSVFNVLGLQGVVFGGGGAGAFEFLAPHIRAIVKKRAFVVDYEKLIITRGTLQDKAPLIGAVALMKQKGY